MNVTENDNLLFFLYSKRDKTERFGTRGRSSSYFVNRNILSIAMRHPF